MSKSRVTWCREHRVEAKDKQKSLFALAFDEPRGESLCYIGVGDETLRSDVESLIIHHINREVGKVAGSAFHADVTHERNELAAQLAALHAAARAYREVAEVPAGNVDTTQDVARDELDAALANIASAAESYTRRMQEQGALWVLDADWRAVELHGFSPGAIPDAGERVRVAARRCAEARAKNTKENAR